jgi:hypothetical protein
MSGFKTGSLSQLFLPRSLQSESNQGKSNPQPTSSRRRDEWKAQGREGTDPQKEKSVPEVWWTTTKTPFPDGRSRKERVCGLLQCARRSDQTEHDVVAKIQTSRSQEDQEGFPLFKIPVPGECGARCYMAHIDQKRWKKGEEDGRRKTKTIFNT